MPNLKRGFVLIELLLVLIVVAILAGSYFTRENTPKKEQSQYQMTIGRTKSAACSANRAALVTTIQMFKLNNPTEAVTSANMQKANINVPKCPEGGAYAFQKDTSIKCSKHSD